MIQSTAPAAQHLVRWSASKVAVAVGVVAVLALAAFLVSGLPLWGRPSKLTAAQAMQRAVAAFREGRLDQAGPYLIVAVSADSNNARAHYMLGLTYERAGRHKEAITEYRSAIHLAPADPAPRYNIALLLITVGEPEAALIEAEAALNAGMPAARFVSGAAYRKLNRWDEAVATYQRLLADEGRLPLDWFQAHLQAGDLEWEHGRAGQATAHWRRARDLDPRYPGLKERLARLP